MMSKEAFESFTQCQAAQQQQQLSVRSFEQVWGYIHNFLNTRDSFFLPCLLPSVHSNSSFVNNVKKSSIPLFAAYFKCLNYSGEALIAADLKCLRCIGQVGTFALFALLIFIHTLLINTSISDSDTVAAIFSSLMMAPIAGHHARSSSIVTRLVFRYYIHNICGPC